MDPLIGCRSFLEPNSRAAAIFAVAPHTTPPQITAAAAAHVASPRLQQRGPRRARTSAGAHVLGRAARSPLVGVARREPLAADCVALFASGQSCRVTIVVGTASRMASD